MDISYLLVFTFLVKMIECQNSSDSFCAKRYFLLFSSEKKCKKEVCKAAADECVLEALVRQATYFPTDIGGFLPFLFLCLTAYTSHEHQDFLGEKRDYIPILL